MSHAREEGGSFFTALFECYVFSRRHRCRQHTSGYMHYYNSDQLSVRMKRRLPRVQGRRGLPIDVYDPVHEQHYTNVLAWMSGEGSNAQLKLDPPAAAIDCVDRQNLIGAALRHEVFQRLSELIGGQSDI